MKLHDLQLQFSPPVIDNDEAADLLRQEYGLDGALKPLPGERDCNYRVTSNNGTQFVLKISGVAEQEGFVDFQAALLRHIAETDNTLGVPKVIPMRDGRTYAHKKWRTGNTHLFRLVSYLEGTPLALEGGLKTCPPDDIGAFQGRLCRALSSFHHSAARYPMPWDISNGLVGDVGLLRFLDPTVAEKVQPHLDRLLNTTLPTLRKQRAQVIHNDMHLWNLLATDSGSLAGVIDFGDAIFAPLVQDLAVSVASLIDSEPQNADQIIQSFVRGFDAAFPLLPEERELLLDAALLRSLLSVALGEYKLSLDPEAENQKSVVDTSKHGLYAIEALITKDRVSVPNRTSKLLARRAQSMSPSYRLFYEEPLHLVRGRGTRVFDATGRAFLDCYNNVPSVGHCHPHVVEALHRQASTINTHTRYLHDEIVRYAERLSATLPEELSVCAFTCTGTEANDLAYQISRTVTRKTGVAVGEGIYHGNSAAVSEISQYTDLPKSWRDHVQTYPVPDSYRGPVEQGDPEIGDKLAALAGEKIDRLHRGPHGIAMLIVDPIFDAPGIFTAPNGYLGSLFQQTRDAGGLVVVDEVQSGLCRLGDNMWGFQDSDVVPDIITMGKPMGNGHPLAVVVAKREIMEEFARSNSYFNTFGGNPVSAAAGNAVLDVVEEQGLLQNVNTVGTHILRGLNDLKQKFDVIGDIRGKGFFIGVDLVSARADRTPNPAAAHKLINSMRRNGVLVSVNGTHDNVIKIRPPLVFSQEDADQLLEVLGTGLTELQKT